MEARVEDVRLAQSVHSHEGSHLMKNIINMLILSLLLFSGLRTDLARREFKFSGKILHEVIIAHACSGQSLQPIGVGGSVAVL